MSMIEKVARAIEPAAFHQFESLRAFCLRNGDDEAEALRTAEWAHGNDVRKALEKARAAIEAMAEPNAAMISAGYEAAKDKPYYSEGQARIVQMIIWRAMIAAALKQE